MSKKYLFIAPILSFQIGCTTIPLHQIPVDANELADQGTHSFPYPKSAVQQAFQKYFTEERNCIQVMEQFSCFDQVPHGLQTKYNKQLYTVEYLPSLKNQTIVRMKIRGEKSFSSKFIFNKISRYLGINNKDPKLTHKEKKDKKEIASKHTDKPISQPLHTSQAIEKNQLPSPNLSKNNQQSSNYSINITPEVVLQPKDSMNKSTKKCMNHAKLGNQIEFANCVDNMPSSYKREGVKLISERASIDIKKQKAASDALKECMAYMDMGDLEEFEECMAKVKTQLPENPYMK